VPVCLVPSLKEKCFSQPFAIFRLLKDCVIFVLWMIYFVLLSDPANAFYSEKDGNEKRVEQIISFLPERI